VRITQAEFTSKFSNEARRSLLIVLAVLLGCVAPRSCAQDKTAELLRELSNAPGPSGLEEPVRKIMVERMTPTRLPTTDSAR